MVLCRSGRWSQEFCCLMLTCGMRGKKRREGKKEVGITLPMVVSTKPPRAYSEPTCEVLQSPRAPLQSSGVQSQPRSPCEAFPSSPTLAGTLWHSSRVFMSVKFDISLMLLERSEGLRAAVPGSPPFLGLVRGCQTVLRSPVRAQAALMGHRQHRVKHPHPQSGR